MNDFSIAIDELGSTDLGKSALETLLILSFLAPDEIPDMLMEMILSSVSETEETEIDFEDFQKQIVEKLKAKRLLNYHEWSESFTMPTAIREIIQSRYDVEEKVEILRQIYFMLEEFFSFYAEEFGDNNDIYIHHTEHALKHNENYELYSEYAAPLFFNVGYDALEKNDYEKAIEFFKQAITADGGERALSSRIPYYQTHLGDVYELQEKYDEAIRVYEGAIHINKEIFGDESSEHAESLSNLGYAVYLSGDYAKAVGIYKQTIEIQTKLLDQNSPDLMYSFHRLANAYAKMGDYKDALVYFEKAGKISENVEIDDAEYLKKLQKHTADCREKLAE